MAKKKATYSLAQIKAELNAERPGTVFNDTDEVGYKEIGFIPTGVLDLDDCLGGGFAKGRIVDLYGPEGSGKCLVAGTLVATEYGLLPIEFFAQMIDPTVPVLGEHPMEIGLYNYNGEVETSIGFTMNGRKPVRTLRTESGREITSTFNHPHLVLRDGMLQWIKTEDIVVGDALVRGRYSLPEQGTVDITEDQAYVLGVLAAGTEMDLDSSDGFVGLVAAHPTERYDSLLKVVNGDFISFLRRETVQQKDPNSLRSIMDYTGYVPSPDNFIEVPLAILSGDESIVGNYLFGLCEAVGDINSEGVSIVLRSQKLAAHAQILFEALGVLAKIEYITVDGPLETPAYRISITGTPYKVFLHRFYPDQFEAPELDSDPDGLAFEMASFGSNLFEEVVRVVDEEEERETYDFAMPDTHSFVANGVVTHNTSLALNFAAQAQKEGKVVFFNCENAYDRDMAISCGVDVDELEVFNVDVAEVVFETIRKLIKSGEISAIIVDSFAGLVPRAALNGEIGDSLVALLGRLSADALKVITSEQMSYESDTIIVFVNQMRDNIGGMGNAPKSKVTGGRAVKYYASTRISAARTETLKRGDQAIGHRVRFKLDKSRLSPPFQTADVELNYKYGYVNEASLIDKALERGILVKSGNYHVIASTGESLANGRQATIDFLVEHPDYYDTILEAIHEYDREAAEEAELFGD